MSSLRGDKHSLNISIKSKDELNYNPATRSITTHQMESIKRMTKTMSIHRQKKVRLIFVILENYQLLNLNYK